MDRFIIAFSGWRHHIRRRGAELGRGCEAGSWGWSDSVRLFCCYLLDILDQSNCLDQLQNREIELSLALRFVEVMISTESVWRLSPLSHYSQCRHSAEEGWEERIPAATSGHWTQHWRDGRWENLEHVKL